MNPSYVSLPPACPPFNNNIPPAVFFSPPAIVFAAGVVVAAWALHSGKSAPYYSPFQAIYGIVTVVGGFCSWHGLVYAAAAHRPPVDAVRRLVYRMVLDRNDTGFELRTVGINPDAARVGRMNVKFTMASAIAERRAGRSGWCN